MLAGVGILGMLGVLLALTGGALLIAPAPARAFLRLAGVRVEPGPHTRVAAWCVIALGLAIALVARAVR